jgi:ATP-binding protein involved in chromosome partitioning
VSAAASRSVVAIGSGKGGVGKSTVALHLALALRRRGATVGLLDADLYGPDIPVMVNLTREERASRWDFWRRGDVKLEPIERQGLLIMSVGFLIGERQALTLQAPLLTAALRQLVEHVDWGEIDVLFVDLPPGTADLQQQLLEVVPLDGAIVVVGPQDVAHLDARKFVDFLKSSNVPLLGGIEHMRGLLCPHCGERIEVFDPVREERSVWRDGVELLGTVPLEPVSAGKLKWQRGAFDAIAARVADRLDRFGAG